MQRSGSSVSAGSWQASIQFPVQIGTAWHRHISAIAAYIVVTLPSPSPRPLHHGKDISAI
jgi:hypothetical protein